jgi:hypothetical protein
MLPWILLAAAVLIGLYYVSTRPAVVTITAPREDAPSSMAPMDNDTVPPGEPTEKKP